MSLAGLARRALVLATALVPGLASATIVLDRLATPWSSSYTVPFGTPSLTGAFEFKETLAGERKTTFYGFTDRLGTLVDQRLRIEAPYVEMRGEVLVAAPVVGDPVIQHMLDIKYLLNVPLGAPDVTLQGGIQWSCDWCPAGSMPFHRKGYFRGGVPPGDLAAPLYGPAFYDRLFLHFASTVSALPGVSFSPDSHSTVDVTVGVYRAYEPKTTVEYLRDALLRVRDLGGRTEKQKAVAAYQDVIALRESDQATSATNLSLRDAEYFLRGYAGGRSLHDVRGPGGIAWDDLGNELGNAGGPAATALYNALKWVRGSLGTPLNEGLPGTPVGGFSPNAVGWSWGMEGKSVDDVLSILAGLPNLPDVRLGLSIDPARPIEPSVRATVIAGDTRIDVNLFDVSIGDLAEVFWFDPQPTTAYGLTVIGNRITRVQLSGDDLAGGDVRIRFGDQDLAFDPLAGLDLTAYVPEGVADLFISGLLTSGPPAFGLRFAQAGDTFLGITEIAPAPVPLPAALPLFATALAALRRRRTARAPAPRECPGAVAR
jgi:hypothetical protein